MKLGGREAKAYFRKPDPDAAGILIYGGDAMRVADRRQETLAALLGPEAEAEMRLTRIGGADLRKDPALLLDAIKAQGFFPGPRAAFVEDATDGIAPTLAAALDDWRPGDAQIVVTAGQLAARSPLRKLFESHRLAHCAAVYNDPPDRDEIDAALKAAGLTRIEADALAALTGLARVLDGGDFRQTLEKIALYKLGDDSPLTADEVALSAPASLEAELDDVIGVVADGQPERIGPLLARLYAQGTGPVAICIGATRHFRLLHAVASDAGGPSAGIGRVRPPVFGPRRDLVLRQASNWGTARLERALTELTDTDLQLRSADRAPQQALVERALIRLAMLGQRR